MVDEVLELLSLREDSRIVDATTGHGGHAEQILERLGSNGLLVGLDRDPEMLEVAEKRLQRFGSRARLFHARFSFLREVAAAAGALPVDGVLLDLGVCSAHLDRIERGMSFRAGDAPVPLDMRMDRSSGETAADLLERIGTEELAQLLRDGGVPAAGRVARALDARRPIRTVQDLVAALSGVRLPERRHHPATLVFQALRMAVNDELAELDAGLESALEVLAQGGRLAVLSYHSGEDRRVKQFMAREAKGCICPPDLPVCGCGQVPRLRIVARGTKPSPGEIRRNPRARSARLRGGVRC
ncbi:MAG: 16S rRNA (cytosine(1402)-N(4))-methyltransferase RsmH [Deltaproteobacteria bacterium]|nr:16S rRNA (cytosine(1402)-N(4))-methyltransferase RsmH [Deltaproteobacteria bacterium]